MNITLNLATRPYIELRSVYARLRLLAVVLLVLGLPMLLVLHVVESRARAAEARVAALHQQTEELRAQQARARALVLEGPNAALIREIEYLNTAFRRKAFSWTATMVDLEHVLPYGVQVRGIEPIVAPNGRVLIRLRVDGPRDKAVEVVRNLERSRHFVAPHLVQETEASQQNGGRSQSAGAQLAAMTSGGAPQVQFDILADYRPLPDAHDRAVAGAEAPDRAADTATVTRTVRAGARGARRRRPAKPQPGITGGAR